jgi:hypothetical protein
MNMNANANFWVQMPVIAIGRWNKGIYYWKSSKKAELD